MKTLISLLHYSWFLSWWWRTSLHSLFIVQMVTILINPLLISSSCTILGKNNHLYESLGFVLISSDPIFLFKKNKTKTDIHLAVWKSSISEKKPAKLLLFWLGANTHLRMTEKVRDLLYEWWRGCDSQHALLIISPSLLTEALPFMHTHSNWSQIAHWYSEVFISSWKCDGKRFS